MLCKNPFVKGSLAFGCGQCMHCRINRRRLWSHRIMLESSQHAGSCFVTLTYDDEHLPLDCSVDPRHFSLFLKRLRKLVHPVSLRYYGCGEYGDISGRPHYHLALFGLNPVQAESVVKEAWKDGLIHVGEITPHSASYIAGYVTKKMTDADDERLNGRHPEFARMSLKPGIGAGAMQDVGRTLLTESGSRFMAKEGDVPSELSIGRKQFPIGRYLKSKLRDEVGIDGSESVKYAAYVAEMSALRKEVGEVAFKVAKPFVDHKTMDKNEAKARFLNKVRKL